jgi:hypothetical protein
VARSYLVFLEQDGIAEFNEADGASVLAFLESLLGRWAKRLSRPVQDCEERPALAGVRKVDLDDPRANRPDTHCNFGDRRQGIRGWKNGLIP